MSNKQKNIISNFYLIREDNNPVYVGYTNRPIKQRFREHLRDKDFTDNVSVEEIDSMTFPFTWDITIINKYAKEVSDRETSLIVRYGTGGSIWQKGVNGNIGGQTWSDIKHFVMTNKDNPKFKNMSDDIILELVEYQRKMIAYLKSVINSTKPLEDIRLRGVINSTKPLEDIRLNSVINNTKPLGETRLKGIISHTKPSEENRLRSVIGGTKPLEYMMFRSVITHTQPAEENRLNNVISGTKQLEYIRLKSVVTRTKPIEETRLKSVIVGTKPLEENRIKNVIGGTKPLEDIRLRSVIHNTKNIDNKKLL